MKYKYEIKRTPVLEFQDAICDSPRAVRDYATQVIGDAEKEHLISVFLNTRNGLLGHSLVSIGLVDRSQAHAREVFREAIIANCTKLVLVHNHPSGDPSPSQGDKSITKSLVEAGKIIGIDVVDHVILGHYSKHITKNYFSFAEARLI